MVIVATSLPRPYTITLHIYPSLVEVSLRLLLHMSVPQESDIYVNTEYECPSEMFEEEQGDINKKGST